MSDEDQHHEDMPASSDDMTPAEKPPQGTDGDSAANGATPEKAPSDDAAQVAPETAQAESALPIPVISALDPRVAADRKRLMHRRKRYTLFLLRTNRRRQQARAQSHQRAIWMTIGVMLAVVLALVGTSAEAAVSYYQSQNDILASLQSQVVSKDSVRIYDEHGTLLTELDTNGVKRSICFNEIPNNIQNATVAIEDKDFWHNNGIDLQRIISAAYQDYAHHQIDQGASTITQQLIKNVVLDNNQTFDRKIKEAILAYGITATGQYSKQQIMTMYLNTVPYGPDIYGLDAAAHQYFDYTDDDNVGHDCNHIQGHVAAEKLDLAQATFLAGIPQNPNQNNPLHAATFAHALDRQKQVLADMVAQHYITQAQSDAAWKESHGVNFLTLPPPIENKAPQFVNFAVKQLSQMVDDGQISLADSGLSIYTTLDLPLQVTTQKIMYQHLFGNDVSFSYGEPIKNDNVSNAAAILVEQNTGDLRVLQGSIDYDMTRTPNGKAIDGKFDVATEGYRQPGSSFKPLIYATAFAMGWFPSMTVNDSPVIFPGSPLYKPLDAERTSIGGEMTIRTALQWSQNIPAIKTLNFVGPTNLLNTMARMGMTSQQQMEDPNFTPGLSAAIGALNVRPIDMVQAYATFANYGRRVPINTIDHIVDAQGNTIYQYSAPRGTQVFSPQVSYMLTSVLTDDQARVAPSGSGFGFGRCSALILATANQGACEAGKPGFFVPAAAKTGTTDNLDDDWTMGYTMKYTGGIWVGNQQESDGLHNIFGLDGAAPIWHRMMLAAYGCTVFPFNPNPRVDSSINATGCDPSLLTNSDFKVPDGLVKATFTSDTKTNSDWFLANNVPTAKDQNIGNGGPINHVCLVGNNGDWNYCGGSSTPGSPAATPTPKPAH